MIGDGVHEFAVMIKHVSREVGQAVHLDLAVLRVREKTAMP
jgi:hypothetical protein